jgi:hypothetical protein
VNGAGRKVGRSVSVSSGEGGCKVGPGGFYLGQSLGEILWKALCFSACRVECGGSWTGFLVRGYAEHSSCSCLLPREDCQVSPPKRGQQRLEGDFPRQVDAEFTVT